MGVDGDFVLCLGGRVEFCKMYLNITWEDYGSDLFHITVLTCQKKQVKTVIAREDIASDRSKP